MDPDTLQGVLLTALGGVGLAMVGLHHHWTRRDRQAAREQRRREIARRMARRGIA